MKITREFIEQHKTRRGGWTNLQCQALGEGWKPAKGWIERAIEADHTPAAIERFIAAATRRANKVERAVMREQRRDEKRAGKVAALAAKLAKPTHSAKPHKVSAEFATSPDFLGSFQWRKLRMQVLKHYGAKCMCCGATPEHGAVMNVDHIKPRKTHPKLALDFDNLQVLCGECNHGKGNWDSTDFRPADEGIDPDVSAFIRSIANARD